MNAWLVIAAIVDQPERKRQCLNRVLSLDPTNQIARDELLQMDRAAMGAPAPSALKPVTNIPQSSLPQVQPAYPSAPSPSTYSASTSAFESAPVVPQAEGHVAVKPSSQTHIEKPLVFSYSSGLLVLIYAMGAFFLCGGILSLAIQDIKGGLYCLVPSIFMLVSALSVTSKVVVSEAGIRNSTLFTSAEIKWNDIAGIQSNSLKRKLKLTSKKGKSVNISAQVKNYQAFIEILRQKRPDLFGADLSSPAQTNPSEPGYEQPRSTSASAFKGTKTFKKNFFGQYGIAFAGIFLCVSLILIIFSVDVHWDFFSITGILLAAGFGAFLFLAPFFAVSAIKLESNKLILSTFFGEREISASQIQEIKIRQTYGGRYGRIKNFVQMTFTDGKDCGLDGFTDGPEVIYGFLTNWWNAYRNR